MAIGPVQLLVIGFDQPDFSGAVLDELERLRQNDTVRVIDSLTVFKDGEGKVTALKLSQMSDEEAVEFGSKVGALIGLGAAGEKGAVTGAELGAEATREGVDIFSPEDAWDVQEDLPLNTAAAVILIEHRWAIPLRDAVFAAGGFPLDSGFISPLDLVGIGLLAGAETD